MPDLHIDRCYCFGQTFAALQRVANAAGASSVETLQTHVQFGEKCGLCHPYVRRMLRTGEVVFNEILLPEDEPATCPPVVAHSSR